MQVIRFLKKPMVVEKNIARPLFFFFFQLNFCSSSLRGVHDFAKRELILSKAY